MKKIFALVLALMLVAGMVSALADWQGNGGTKTITVHNAMKGETYSIYKLFDATVDGNNIAYTLKSGDTAIPTDVAGIFQLETITEGTAPNERTYSAITKIGTPTDAAVQAALKDYATHNASAKVGEIECTGSTVAFTDLTDGYYIIVSTFNDGKSETIEKVIGTSTTTDGCDVYEKNTTEVTVVKTGDTDYSIGDVVTYTVTFNGPNYRGSGSEARIVTKYTVKDTLPQFLSRAQVTKIKIGTTEYTGTTGDTGLTDANFPGVTTFGTTKTFDIPWATKGTGAHDWTSKYPNGTSIEITYTATLTQIVKIDGTTNTGNKNIVDIQPVTDTPDGGTPWDEHLTDDHEIFTYGAALKKTDGTSTLAGAKFHFKGLDLTPANHYEKGVYFVSSYDPSDSADYGTEVEVGADGMLYILGLASDVDLIGEETVAPSGHNKLTSTFTLEPQVMSHTIWTYAEDRYFDEDGNVVSESVTSGRTTEVTKNMTDLDAQALEIINNKGTELPDTGGIGTTIFYVGGGILVLAAVILLVTKRRMNAKDD